MPNNTTRESDSSEFPKRQVVNAFSVDVEDYYQVSAWDGSISRQQWPGFKSRVVKSTHRLLQLLDTNDVKGTFYILGYVAEQHPQLVKDIADAGHEVGCHSYWHHRVDRLSEAEFRKDTLQCKSLLEDLCGREVTNYRAPSFSITSECKWAWNVLAELGFQVDSSLCPARHGQKSKVGLHQIETKAGALWQFPISVRRLGKLCLPISGGGYFRLFPYNWNVQQLHNVNKSGHPFVFYIHPWEVDPDQPRMGWGTLQTRFRHYLRLDETFGKLEQLLNRFRFSTIDSLVQEKSLEAAA